MPAPNAVRERKESTEGLQQMERNLSERDGQRNRGSDQ